jgi:hypothetical protein
MADRPIPGSGITDPTDDAAEQKRSRRSTIAIIATVILLVALVTVLTPVSDDAGDTRLTTAKYGPGNARLASDLARRLGWQVSTRGTPLTGALDTTVIYAVFDGPTPMLPPERSALLTAVRSGAGLLVAPSSNEPSALLAALGLTQGRAGLVTPTSLGDCPPQTDAFAALRVRSRMLTFDTVPDPDANPSDTPYPAGARTLLSSDVTIDPDDKDYPLEARRTARGPVSASVDSSRAAAQTDKDTAVTVPRPTVVEFPYGRGRVVALADPDLLRTDQMRNCAMGPALTIVRGLEALSAGRSKRIVFAEYYQGLRTDGPGVVLWEWLRDTGPGRAVLTLIAACLVLLLARGRRTLAPVYHVREERRSALEHVDALATAWRAVRGTRTVARLLARGIRRRHAAGRWRSLDDIAFLAALAERHPRIADDAARLTQAITSPVSPSDLPALRQAAAHIDAECLTP